MRWFRRFLPRTTTTRPAPRRRLKLGLESLEDRTLLAVNLPTPGTPGSAKITGTTGADQMIIRLQPGVPTNVQLSDNGGANFGTAALRDVTDLVVNGLAGRDTLTLDHSNGFVGRIGFLPLTYDGGPGYDTLAVVGNPNLPGMNTNYLVGSTSDAGRLDTTNGTISISITFSQLSAIIDVANGSGFSLNLNDSPNVVKIERDRPFNGLNVLRLEGVDQQARNDALDLVVEDRPLGDRRTDTRESFVPITLANKGNVTVNTFGGDDLITQDHSRAVTGLVSFTIDGGNGTDRVLSENGPRGPLTSLVSIEKFVPEGIDDVFIEEMYISRLKRGAAESEVDSWRQVLRGPAGRQGVILGIERSVESRTRQVRGWYEQYLNRTASGNEEQGWVNALAQGAFTEEQILSGILGSPEYYTRAGTLFSFGTADEKFFRALYSQLLGRAPGGGELNNWLVALPNFGRAGAAGLFLGSAEFRGRVIDALYATFLQRDADPGGRNAWVFSGLDYTRLREGFAGSLEFYDLNHATAAAVTLDAAGNGRIQGTSINQDDKQYFFLTAPRTGRLNFTVQTTNNRFAKLQVEDANGVKLFETEPRDGINSGNVQVRAGALYFFRLRSPENAPAGFIVNLSLT